MTVYVDQLHHYPAGVVRAMPNVANWCHMWTDGDIDELHQMAYAIGMKRSWFQDHKILKHYDLVSRRRTQAIRLGAVERDVKDFLREQMRIANGSSI